jgi:hypothetical protein
MNVDPVTIPYDTTRPFPTKKYPATYTHTPDDQAILDEDHQYNLDNDIIEPAPHPGPFLTPKFVSHTKRHKPRPVYNFKPTNDHLTTLQQPYPSFDNEIHDLSHATYYTKLDLKSGYHQIPLHPDSRFLTNHLHRGRLFQFQRLPMGISSAPAIFQHLMLSIFGHLPFLKVYLDDIIIYSSNLDDHLAHVEEVLTLCRQYNIYLSPTKCTFTTTETTFLGHTISNGFVSSPPTYIEPIVEQPLPTNVSALRTFIGQITFIARHLPQIQLHLAPFHQLISAIHRTDKRKKAPITWTPELTSKYHTLQHYVKHNYHHTLIRTFYLYTDASRTGCGAVLLQLHPTTNQLTPISFFSHLWHPPAAYAVRDLELHAVHLALRHWRHLLATGNPIHLFTDHKSLTNPIDPETTTTPAPIAHWIAHIFSYNLHLTYIKGVNNTIADTLSRYLPKPPTTAPPPPPATTSV